MNRLIASVLVVSALALTSVNISAQEPLESFVELISSSPYSFKYSFEVKTDVTMKGDGEVFACGKSFKLDGNGIEIISDGVNRWTIDHASKEAYIEDVDDETIDYVSNPALLLMNLNVAFRKVDSMTFQSVTTFSMKPVSSDTGLSSLELQLKGSIPVCISFVSDDGIKSKFNISSFVVKKEGDVNFSFDITSLDSEYVVTDLR